MDESFDFSQFLVSPVFLFTFNVKCWKIYRNALDKMVSVAPFWQMAVLLLILYFVLLLMQTSVECFNIFAHFRRFIYLCLFLCSTWGYLCFYGRTIAISHFWFTMWTKRTNKRTNERYAYKLSGFFFRFAINIYENSLNTYRNR